MIAKIGKWVAIGIGIFLTPFIVYGWTALIGKFMIWVFDWSVR